MAPVTIEDISVRASSVELAQDPPMKKFIAIRMDTEMMKLFTPDLLR